MRSTTRIFFSALVAALALPLTAQIRDFVPVVRPVYYQETVTFLENLSASMKSDGYDEAAAILKSYASGGFGSGFVVVAPDGGDYVVTNRHVVSQAASVTLEFQKSDDSQTVYKDCPVVAVDEELDLALVAFPKKAKPFASGLAFAVGPADDGLEVWSAGYPGLGGTPAWQLGKGNVTNGRAKVPELADPAITSLIQHSAQVDPGNSGGPLLVVDKSSPAGYKVIGVNTWKVVDRQATNFSIPASAIQKFVATALSQSAQAGPQAPLLEARCRDFIGAAAKKDDAYKAIARFISYSYVASAGEGILKDVLAVAPTAVRDDILSVFSDVSPIEGIRLAIAYKVASTLTAKDGPVTLAFVAVDGNADAATNPVPVRFTRDGKELSLPWVREHGVWRLASYPLGATSSVAKSSGAKSSGGSADVTFDETPYNFLLSAGTEFSFSSGEGMFWDINFTMVPSAYVGLTLSAAFRSSSFTDNSYYSTGSTTSGVLARIGGEVRLQLPVQTSTLAILPYAGLEGGLILDTAAMSDPTASSSGFYSLAEGGVQVGFGEEPTFYVGSSYKMYLFNPSSVTGPSIGIWVGLKL